MRFTKVHPNIAWIKLENFTVVKKLTTAEVIKDFRQLVRLNAWLATAPASETPYLQPE